jgi:hypothetical protein
VRGYMTDSRTFCVGPIKPGSALERPGVTKGQGLIDADRRAIQWLYCEGKKLPGSGDRAIDTATTATSWCSR